MNVLTVTDRPTTLVHLCFSPDGRALGVVTTDSRVLYMADLPTGAVRQVTQIGGYCPPDYGFAAGGAEVVTVQSTGAAVVDTATGEGRRAVTIPQALYGLAVSPDGRTLVATLRDGESMAAARYDLSSGEPRPVVGRSRNGVGRVAFSADGGRLVVGSYKQLRVWQVGPDPAPRAAAVLKAREGGWVKAVAISGEGRWVAAVARTTGYLWDTQTKGREPTVFTGRGRATEAVAFHPIRPLFATAGTDRTVNFWDPASGQQVRKFAWEIGELTAVAFSPDGLQAAAAGDGRVVLWDVD